MELVRVPSKILGLTLLCAEGFSSFSDVAAGREAGTIGLVLIGRHVAMYETPGAKQECPEGFQFDSISDNFRAQFPSQAEQQAQIARCGSRDNRGPNCENVFYEPSAVSDPLPFREVKSPIAYGMNLDGTLDGHATATTCSHQKFQSPNGDIGIDNQFYRVTGCEKAWRKDGVYDDYSNRVELIERLAGRVLVEVSGVENERNDPSVDVTIYKGKDHLLKDSTSHIQPWLSQRIDERFPQYVQHLRGKIIDGVLITEPFDVRLPIIVLSTIGELQLKEMRLRLTLTPSGANGLMAGYHDIDQWWMFYSRAANNINAGYAVSPPSKYEALHRLADGRKNPNTGQCTAISAAYQVEFVRAFIIHPNGREHLPE